MLRILLVTLGTRGDFDPFLKMGAALRDRGHEVILISHAVYAAHAEAIELEFHAVDTIEAHQRFLSHPDHWNWRKNFDLSVEQFLLPNVMPVYRKVVELHRPGRTVVVGHPVTMGVRLAEEVIGVPAATVEMAPNWIRSVYDTPLHFPPAVMVWWRGALAKAIAYRVVDAMIDGKMKSGLNAIRKELGLEPLRRVHPWLDSPQRVIGPWPEWYAAPQPDWPPQVRLTGFLASAGRLDGSEREAEFPDLEGKPTVVFTAGTGMVNGREFFGSAVAACQALGLRGLLVTQYPEQLPAPLPSGVTHVSYTPFETLLPRCAAIVHHGGIGTAAQALAAGIPQVILPNAVDQFDNARRLCRLGVARTNYRSVMRPEELTRMLRELLESETVAERCRHWQSQVGLEEALSRTCDLVEALAREVPCSR